MINFFRHILWFFDSRCPTRKEYEDVLQRFEILCQEHNKLQQQLDILYKEKEKFRLLGQQYYDKVRHLEQRITQIEQEKEKYLILCKQYTEQNSLLTEQNTKLEKWKPVVNAEDKANAILIDAQQKLEESESQSKKIIASASETSSKMIYDASTAADALTEKAQKEADRILAEANEQSHKTLANIKPEADRLSAVAKAMQNKIAGYGMEYMVPGIGLLDELAVDFGHTEAGQKLKQAREKVRIMFKAGEAALCDYSETNRRITAVAFVADAFNGKAEDILSRVKHNNYGILSQEIKDAAVLVNTNGEAFRNARIAPQYVIARLDELKWATVVHELALKEREEQKAIREQMREEAKVQKEIERANKEAEKEAALAQKIYSELQKKFEAMSAEEKAQHAQEMEDAKERIRIAEEKGQRAISMAQQTKAGYVYVISNIGSFGENVFKIGMTRRLDPTERVYELGDASVPFPFDIHGMIHFNNAPEAETQLHKIFVLGQVNKVNTRKEFFRAELNEIKAAVEKLGGEAMWTITAEAAQYRETLRIEERIANDDDYRSQWEDRQLRLEALETDEEHVE